MNYNSLCSQVDRGSHVSPINRADTAAKNMLLSDNSYSKVKWYYHSMMNPLRIGSGVEAVVILWERVLIRGHTARDLP